MAAMTETRLDVLKRTGQSPIEAVTIAETLEADRRRIVEERYQRDRELEEIARVTAAAAERMAETEAKLIAAAEKERDQELAGLDKEIAALTATPVRELSETDAEYGRRLVSRQVLVLDQVRRTQLAALDAQSVAETTDPQALVMLAEEYIAANQPDLTGRIGRLIEGRLARLARTEIRKLGGVPGPSPAGNALALVQDRLRQWRGAEARKSPSVRRQSVVERHKNRIDDIRRGVQLAAGADVSAVMARAGVRAQIAAVRA